ncbi:MAG: hypothetical protein JNG83_02605 [Opitutaceae bacterium]|nr:hypothetical protein [Opitutaceae bacterium]
MPPDDDGAPVGPTAEEESAFLAEQRLDGAVPVAAPAAGADEENGAPLPPMDELVNRIPAPVREAMEELFRARFVTVRRLPKSAMKP